MYVNANRVRLIVSMPLLDALIIPKAVYECKTMCSLFANLSNVFLSWVLYHISQVCNNATEAYKERALTMTD